MTQTKISQSVFQSDVKQLVHFDATGKKKKKSNNVISPCEFRVIYLSYMNKKKIKIK